MTFCKNVECSTRLRGSRLDLRGHTLVKIMRFKAPVQWDTLRYRLAPGIDVYKVYDVFVMISSFETIAGAPED